MVRRVGGHPHRKRDSREIEIINTWLQVGDRIRCAIQFSHGGRRRLGRPIQVRSGSKEEIEEIRRPLRDPPLANHPMSHRPMWMSNFTKPSSRIFKRRDGQASSFTTLARFMTSWTLSGFLAGAREIYSIIQHDYTPTVTKVAKSLRIRKLIFVDFSLDVLNLLLMRYLRRPSHLDRHASTMRGVNAELVPAQKKPLHLRGERLHSPCRHMTCVHL